MRSRRSKWTWAPLACVVWASAVGVGFRVLVIHERTSGAQEEAPARWPWDTTVSRDATRPTLLLFLHPQCPCSRATVAELERLMARASGRLAARVLFVVPRGL